MVRFLLAALCYSQLKQTYYDENTNNRNSDINTAIWSTMGKTCWVLHRDLVSGRETHQGRGRRVLLKQMDRGKTSRGDRKKQNKYMTQSTQPKCSNSPSFAWLGIVIKCNINKNKSVLNQKGVYSLRYICASCSFMEQNYTDVYLLSNSRELNETSLVALKELNKTFF